VPDLVASIARAPAQQGKLSSVRGILEKFGMQAAAKSVLRRLGFGVYAQRPPLLALDPARERELFAMLDMFGVVKRG
jgi:hypothetical protein